MTPSLINQEATMLMMEKLEESRTILMKATKYRTIISGAPPMVSLNLGLYSLLLLFPQKEINEPKQHIVCW